MANLRIRRFGENRFGAPPQTKTGSTDHGHIIGAIANGQRLRCINVQIPAIALQGHGLGVLAEHRITDLACQHPVLGEQFIGLMGTKSGLRGNTAGKIGEAAGHQRGHGAMGRHGLHQGAGAGIEGQALFITALQQGNRLTLEQAHTLAQGRFKIQRPGHGRFGHGAHLIAKPGQVRQLVQAFLTDYGAVHVTDKKGLARCRAGVQTPVQRQAIEGFCHSGAPGLAAQAQRFTRRQSCFMLKAQHTGAGACLVQRRIARAGNKDQVSAHLGVRHVQSNTPPILLIYGPTASGKSALALSLAQRFDGEIINADSMQVYDGIPVLTAQPDRRERDGAPHHLYGWRDPAGPCSAGVWQNAALETIETVRKRGKLPILVGGTGLYFETLTRGLADIPPVGGQARDEAAGILHEQGPEGLRAALVRVDPAAAQRIQGADRQRLLRALGVYLQTGKSLSAWQAHTTPAVPPGAWMGMVVVPEKAQLYKDIASRFALMLEHGAVDEARAMAARRLDGELPVMKALGLRPLINHIHGKISLDCACALAIRDTRRYAKRQMTWSRGRFTDWPVLAALSAVGRGRAAARLVMKRLAGG